MGKYFNFSFVHHYLALNKLHRHFHAWKKIKNIFFKWTFSGRLVARQPPRILADRYKNLRVMHSS